MIRVFERKDLHLFVLKMGTNPWHTLEVVDFSKDKGIVELTYLGDKLRKPIIS